MTLCIIVLTPAGQFKLAVETPAYILTQGVFVEERLWTLMLDPSIAALTIHLISVKKQAMAGATVHREEC